MHKIKYLSVIFFLLFIISCNTTGKLTLFGSEKQVIDNLYIEYMNIGDVYYSLEKYDKAIEYYKKASENDDLYWSCFYKLAKTYALSSNWAEASVSFEKLLERDPENSNLKASLAYIKALNGQVEEAKKIYEELIEQFPENQLFLENYIAILFLEKNIAEIAVPLSVLKDLFPESANITKIENQLKNELEKQKQEEIKKE